MYWLPEMHKAPIGARFIAILKNCSTKALSGIVSQIFEISFNTLESFNNKISFIQVVENSKLRKTLFQLSINETKSMIRWKYTAEKVKNKKDIKKSIFGVNICLSCAKLFSNCQ